MIKTFPTILIAAIFLFSNRTSFAVESNSLDLIGDVGISDKTMGLKIRRLNGGGYARSFDAKFTTLDASITAAYGKFYATFSHERSIKDHIASDDNGLIFFSRTDNTLTAGLNVWGALTAFGGYRIGNTTSYHNKYTNQVSVLSSGPFLGVNYSIIMGDTGAVGLSVAMARLNGRVSLYEPFVERDLFPLSPSPPENVEGSALGFSLGLSWVGYLGETTTYSARLKLHRYLFEDQVIYKGIDLSFEESFVTLSMGLTRYF